MESERRQWLVRVLEATELQVKQVDPDADSHTEALFTDLVELQARLRAQLRTVDGDELAS